MKCKFFKVLFILTIIVVEELAFNNCMPPPNCIMFSYVDLVKSVICTFIPFTTANVILISFFTNILITLKFINNINFSYCLALLKMTSHPKIVGVLS